MIKNSQYYKYQAEELDSMVSELRFELKNKIDSESFLQVQIHDLQEIISMCLATNRAAENAT